VSSSCSALHVFLAAVQHQGLCPPRAFSTLR
jgi:hypothetical protein